MEFIIAGVGLAVAVWMILGARNRNRPRRDAPADGAAERTSGRAPRSAADTTPDSTPGRDA